jgi:uncharacterized protein (TIGR00725 family)
VATTDPMASALTVAVIGSARLCPPDPRCVPAEKLGAAIATHGWTTMTGGYGGLMEVVSRAAAEAGGRVIGLPMSGWSNLTPNRWNHELRWSQNYPERLAHLLAADVVVALDGGVGTMSEAAVVWAARQTEPKAADLIFLGAGWQPVLQSIAASLVISESDLAYVAICADLDGVIARITQSRSRLGASKPRG